jgi:hypothetical protein
MNALDTNGAKNKMKRLQEILANTGDIAGKRIDPKRRPTIFSRSYDNIEK